MGLMSRIKILSEQPSAGCNCRPSATQPSSPMLLEDRFSAWRGETRNEAVVVLAGDAEHVVSIALSVSQPKL